MLTFMPVATSANLTPSVSLGGSHTDTGRTCTLHTDRPQVRVKGWTSSLWGGSANHHITVMPFAIKNKISRMSKMSSVNLLLWRAKKTKKKPSCHNMYSVCIFVLHSCRCQLDGNKFSNQKMFSAFNNFDRRSVTFNKTWFLGSPAGKLLMPAVRSGHVFLWVWFCYADLILKLIELACPPRWEC